VSEGCGGGCLEGEVSNDEGDKASVLTISRSRKKVDKPVSDEAADNGRARLNPAREGALSDWKVAEKPREVEGRRGVATCGTEYCGKKGGRAGPSLVACPGDGREGVGGVERGRGV
jgi:putative hemolysin